MMVQETVGELLRAWRRRRRFSQLDLACEAQVSTRHLSFVESGRSAASRDMLLRLAGPLSMPLRDRNRLLLAGGYAPLHTERPLADPELSAVRSAIATILKGHEPYPALAIDRRWNLVEANAALGSLLVGVAPFLLEPPINVLRLSLHPAGLASRILNLSEWRHHLLQRLRRDAEASGDAALTDLLAQLSGLRSGAASTKTETRSPVAVPLMLRDEFTGQRLAFISTTTVFGTALDVTLSEITLECFFPADEVTREALANAG